MTTQWRISFWGCVIVFFTPVYNAVNEDVFYMQNVLDI